MGIYLLFALLLFVVVLGVALAEDISTVLGLMMDSLFKLPAIIWVPASLLLIALVPGMVYLVTIEIEKVFGAGVNRIDAHWLGSKRKRKRRTRGSRNLRSK